MSGDLFIENHLMVIFKKRPLIPLLRCIVEGTTLIQFGEQNPMIGVESAFRCVP